MTSSLMGHNGRASTRSLMEAHPAVDFPGLYDTMRRGRAVEPVDVPRHVAHPVADPATAEEAMRHLLTEVRNSMSPLR